ncbi:MAG: DNA-3-methyladenine glycosylase, partial [Gaiellaceae bacterium]
LLLHPRGFAEIHLFDAIESKLTSNELVELESAEFDDAYKLQLADGTDPALLGRARAPTHGLEQMRARRGCDDPRLLCAGPGRLCQALGITGAEDGLPLDRPPFAILPREHEPEIARAPRIGITRAREHPWRLCEAGSRYLSRGLPRGLR